MRRWMMAAVIAALTVGTVSASVAGAAEKKAHAWWWRVQPGLLGAAIPPPGVPEDGLAVEAGPDGPNAISAVRYIIDEGETRPTLVLTVADQQGELEIHACAATESWEAAHGGSWGERPTYDCGTAVDGRTSKDGKTWRWELETLLRKGQLDVVLVPAPGAGRATFEPPDDASLETQREEPSGQSFQPPPVSDFSGGGSSSGSGPPGESSSSDFAGDSSNVEAPAFSAPDSSGSASGPLESAQPPAVAPPGSSHAPQPQAAGPLGPDAAQTAAVPPASDSSRTVGAIIAAMAAALGLAMWHQDSAIPRRMGALTKGGVGVAPQSYGGLGRFARPRTGRPRPLL